MKVLLINAVCGTGSTGKICAEIAHGYSSKGHEVKIAYGRHAYVPENCQKYAVRIGTDIDVKLHALFTRITDKHGLASKKATKKFLTWAEKFSPDILWLHNIHGYYINYELLFAWIKKHPKMEVKWTLHDCWAFTGHCPHFTAAGCDKWKIQCSDCPEIKQYPASNVMDNSKNNYKRKRRSFCGVQNMTIITPSKWLANLVKESYLKEYPVEVVYNTIDTNIFKPTESTFRKEHNIEDKKIILGVANVWNARKGFNDFIELATLLPNKYAIVLVGLDEKQLKDLPHNIIGVMRTNGQKELAGIYTVADVFVNLTYEDTYPTVNLEAKACGTPVITYRTGGSVESVDEDNIIEVGDIRSLYKKIETIC